MANFKTLAINAKGRPWLIIVQLILYFTQVNSFRDICDPEEFYLPYVRLLKTRQPYHASHPLAKLHTGGYISLRHYTGLLCINGPAVVYSSITMDDKCGVASELVIEGEPKVYNHECNPINRFSPNETYATEKEKGLQSNSKILGWKVFGVFLVAHGTDYREPVFKFFPHVTFGYDPTNHWCVWNGAAVAFVIKSEENAVHCYNIEKLNMTGTVFGTYTSPGVFCFRDDNEEDFDTPWRNQESPLNKPDIIWDDDTKPDSIQCDKKPSKKTKQGGGSERMVDFRIIDPDMLRGMGSDGIPASRVKNKLQPVDEEEEYIPVFSQPMPPGSLFPGEPGYREPGNWQNVKPGKGKTDEEYQKFVAEITDCTQLPELTPNDPRCQDTAGNDGCDIIKHALTIEETDWSHENLRPGSWRLQYINLINRIYEKACPQVPKFFASAVSRIFQYFLTKALEADATLRASFAEIPTDRKHEGLLDDLLKQCEPKAESIVFFKKTNDEIMELREKFEKNLTELYDALVREEEEEAAAEEQAASDPQNMMPPSASPPSGETESSAADQVKEIEMELSEPKFKFPYTIYVSVAGSRDFAEAKPINEYREAIELDYVLDWAIDAYWKVISTVIGYCIEHYEPRRSFDFMSMEPIFSDFFLLYVKKTWIEGDRNKDVYDQLFGEFIYGSGSLWIEACLNGAYQWIDEPGFRPLRHLQLKSDDGDTRGTPVPPGEENFFIDKPPDAVFMPNPMPPNPPTAPKTTDTTKSDPDPTNTDNDKTDDNQAETDKKPSNLKRSPADDPDGPKVDPSPAEPSGTKDPSPQETSGPKDPSPQETSGTNDTSLPNDPNTPPNPDTQANKLPPQPYLGTNANLRNDSMGRNFTALFPKITDDPYHHFM